MRRLLWGVAGVVLMLVAFAASTVRFVGPRGTPAATGEAHAQASATEPPVAGRARPVPVSLSEPQGIPKLRIPVAGVAPSDVHDSWGDSRANGQRLHTGTDIMAAGGTPVVAAAGGTVEKLFFSHGGGGNTVYVRSPGGGWSYYYAHLAGYAPGLHEGETVAPGALLGFVGDTGNAGTGNFHLHFGVSRMGPGERWYQGTPINPYPLLADGAGGR